MQGDHDLATKSERALVKNTFLKELGEILDGYARKSSGIEALRTKVLTHSANKFVISDTSGLTFTVFSAKQVDANGLPLMSQPIQIPPPLVITRGSLQDLSTELRNAIRNVKKLVSVGITNILKTNTSFNVRPAIVSDAFIELLQGSGAFLDKQNQNGWSLRRLGCLGGNTSWSTDPNLRHLISGSAVNSIIAAYNEFANLKGHFKQNLNNRGAQDGTGQQVYGALANLPNDQTLVQLGAQQKGQKVLERLMAYDDNMKRVFRAPRPELNGQTIEAIVNAQDRERINNYQAKGSQVSNTGGGVYYVAYKQKTKKNPQYKKAQDPTAPQSERSRKSNKARTGTTQKTVTVNAVSIVVISTGYAFDTESVMTLCSALKKKKEATPGRFSMTEAERAAIANIKPRKLVVDNRVSYRGGDVLKALVDENTQIQLMSQQRAAVKKAAGKAQK